MAYNDDDAVRRLRKKEADRFKKTVPPDPDVVAERPTRDKMAKELLKLKTEAEFRTEFVRTMKSYGLQVEPEHLENAVKFWRAHH
jgi:hypothetical protein